MNKAEAQVRLDMLHDCLRHLPDDTRILACDAHYALYDGSPPAVHVYNPLPSFDMRTRHNNTLVRYTKRIGDVCVFWLVNEPVPEDV